MASNRLTTDKLLEAVNRLPLSELDDFIRQVLALRAKYDVPISDSIEKGLLEKINQRLPEEIQTRYDHLIAKRKAETLTQDEHQELLRLTDHVESQQVERVRYLIELAMLRKTTLQELVKSLGPHPKYD